MQNDSFIVQGGHKLNGTITPSGNKNEALPVIAAALLTEEEVIIDNIPNIKDTRIMIEVASKLGVKVKKITDHKYSFNSRNIDSSKLYGKLTSQIRSSLLFMAPLLIRCGTVIMPSSGGDKIGKRRIDTHLLAFQKLGAEVRYEENCSISLEKAKGTYMLLDEASVMATENAIMLAVLAEGRTTIYNAACEPHVQGLCNMLNAMGGKITGIGTNLIIIDGVTKLYGCNHKIMPDHIEIGSLIGLAVATGSNMRIKGAYNRHLDIILPAYKKLGIDVKIEGEDLLIDEKQKLQIIDDIGGKIPVIYDQPWPSFPADLTSIMVVTALFSKGTVMIHEKLFESRMFFADSLIRMGGRMVICDPHRIVITGPCQLKGVELSSPDIRAGMALLIAALAAEGQSVIHNVKQIDRGYENIEERLNALGAKIERKII